ncbi:WXG100 family type VII secretion target [Streptomyces odontomachi]|uniref:WXG100 family type VII secretion target n=1 Tax=Streptomyces odontomachi TaxID=2944940 RepID=UPI00210DC894|nr:WXG100 family type VII secretion target [Streptomyces sp. ODS25]
MANPHYDELAVKYGGLDAMATELGNQANKLEQDLHDIRSAVHAAAQGWEGDAHTTYREVQQAWDKDAQVIHKALADITRLVHNAGGDYRGGDKKAASYFT